VLSHRNSIKAICNWGFAEDLLATEAAHTAPETPSCIEGDRLAAGDERSWEDNSKGWMGNGDSSSHTLKQVRRRRIILFYLHFCLHLSYAYRLNQEMMVYLNMLALRSRALPFL
jgi:hypothetical protein